MIAAALPSISRVSSDVPGVAAPSAPVPAAHSLLFCFRLSLDNTEAELHSLFVRTKSLKENIQRDRELCQQMEDFLQVSDSSQSLYLLLSGPVRPLTFAGLCLWKQQVPIHGFPTKPVKGA